MKKLTILFISFAAFFILLSDSSDIEIAIGYIEEGDGILAIERLEAIASDNLSINFKKYFLLSFCYYNLDESNLKMVINHLNNAEESIRDITDEKARKECIDWLINVMKLQIIIADWSELSYNNDMKILIPLFFEIWEIQVKIIENLKSAKYAGEMYDYFITFNNFIEQADDNSSNLDRINNLRDRLLETKSINEIKDIDPRNNLN